MINRILILMTLILLSSCSSKKKAVSNSAINEAKVEIPITNKSNSDSSAQNVIYHSILTGINDKRPIIIERWNNKVHSKKQIRETIDNKNRVTQLEFLRNGKLSEFGYFPIAKVTYEYTENKIVETTFDKHEETLYVDKYVAHYNQFTI